MIICTTKHQAPQGFVTRLIAGVMWMCLHAGIYAEGAKPCPDKCLTIYTPDSPPLITRDLKEDEPFVLMVREILEPQGYQLTLRHMPPNRALQRTKAGLIHTRFPAWLRDEDRDKYVLSETVFEAEWQFYADKNKQIDLFNEELVAEYAAVGIPVSLPDLASRVPKSLRLIQSGVSRQEHLELLARGRADVWIVERYMGRHLLNRYYPSKINDYHVLGTYLHLNVGMISSNKTPLGKQIIDDFNAGLARLKKTGRFEELMNQAIGRYR